MKKIVIALAVALTGFSIVVQAATRDRTFYSGTKIGWSGYHDALMDHNYIFVGNAPIQKNKLGSGAFLGYQINKYLGFEVGYDWLGLIQYKSDIKNGSFKAQGMQMTAKLNYPVLEDFDVYTRLGGMLWHAESIGHLGNDGKKIIDDDVGISPLAAVGLEYSVTKNLVTRLEYQGINNIGDSSTIGARPDNLMINLGVAYRFQDSTPIVREMPTIPTEPEKFTLNADVLFNFDDSELKPEALKQLDDLYSQLSSINPKNGNVIVLGYTDRIGTETYNEALSERRARSVMAYLIGKGIPSDKILAKGMGESNQETGSNCGNDMKIAEKIKCFALDRRVVIEIKGEKEAVIQQQQ